MTHIGERIKQRRLELGMTQGDLADKLGYTNKSTIGKIETGVNDIVQSKVVEFAKALDTTPAFLMGWDEPNTIAAHHDAEDWTEEELAEIEEFKKFVKSKRNK